MRTIAAIDHEITTSTYNADRISCRERLSPHYRRFRQVGIVRAQALAGERVSSTLMVDRGSMVNVWMIRDLEIRDPWLARAVRERRA